MIKKKAFTLIELLITTIIIGILAFTSIAVFNNYIVSAKESSVKEIVNELYRNTILYAREKDVLYSELSIEEISNRFDIDEPEYGKIVYVASDNDFFYEVSLENGEGWRVGIVSTVYANTHEINEYYAMGTYNAIEYFKSLSSEDRKHFIEVIYFGESKNILDRNNLPESFNYKIVSSPWKEGRGDIILMGHGGFRINVIKAIRTTLGLGLKDSISLVDNVPQVIKSQISPEEILEIKDSIEVAGGTVRINGGNGGGKSISFAEIQFKNILLTSHNNSKISVLKAIRSILGLGLRDAKDFVENTPNLIKANIEESEALEIKNIIEEAGGSVNIIES